MKIQVNFHILDNGDSGGGKLNRLSLSKGQNWQILVFGCEFSSFRLFLGTKICGNRYLSGKPFIGYGIMCKNERVIDDGDPQIDQKNDNFFQ